MHRYLRENVLEGRREVAAEAQDSRDTALEEPAIPADAKVRLLRRAGP